MNDPDDPKISAAERALFRGEAGAVRRARGDERVSPAPRRPSPHPRFTEADEAEVMAHLLDHPLDPEMLESGEELYFHRPGVQRRVMRKLRRGQYRIDGELDLHGMTVPMARQALSEFLANCRSRDLRCVRIIHGKGLRSNARGPVLKAKADAWLRRREDVLAYCSTPPNDGGTGAVYVLLRHRF